MKFQNSKYLVIIAYNTFVKYTYLQVFEYLNPVKIVKRHRECQRMSFQWETNALRCIPLGRVWKKTEKRREEEARQAGEAGCTSEQVPRTDGSWKQLEKRVRRANSERGVLTRFLRAYASDSHSRSRDVLELVPRVNSSSWCMNKFSDSTIDRIENRFEEEFTLEDRFREV